MRGASAMAKRQKRVFILGGGAALGAHHVGALKLLEERGIVPDAIIGSSIGCINACCYGSGGVAGGAGKHPAETPPQAKPRCRLLPGKKKTRRSNRRPSR